MRGSLNAACGLGATAAKAWASVQFEQSSAKHRPARGKEGT